MIATPETHTTMQRSPEKPPDFFIVFSDLLQLYALHEEPNAILVQGPGGCTGRIELEHGGVVHAALDELEGQEAFFRMMRWPRGKLVKRTFTEPTRRTITSRLSELLMDAYWKLDEQGALADEGPAARGGAEVISLEEPTERPEDEDLQRRLLWGERLAQELIGVEQLVSYNVLNQRGDILVQNGLGGSHVDSSNVSSIFLGSITEIEALEDDFELMLSLPEHHHVMLGIHGRLSGMFHCVFDSEQISLAMAHWKTRQFAQEYLPRG